MFQSAPVLLDAATRIRPGSMSVSMALESPVPPAASPRMPSTRPIDHRWDRSRGIVFNNARRPLTSDQTGFPANPISCARFSTTTRRDKHAPIGMLRKPSDNKPKLTETGSSQAPKGMPAKALSKGAVEAMQQDIDEKAKQIQQLQKSKQETEEERDGLQRELQTSRTRYAEMLEDLKIEKEKAREQTKRSAKEEYGRKVRELNKSHDNSIADLKAQHQAEISRLEQEYKQELERDPRYTAIVQEMEKQEEQRKADRLREQEQHSENEEKFRESLEQTQQLQDQLKGQIAEAEESERQSLEKLNERSQRTERDRSNYTVYRTLFDDYRGSVYPVLDQLRDTEKDLESEVERWRTSVGQLEDWKKNVNKLFDQHPKYKATGKAILEFLDEKAANADAACGVLEDLRKSLHSDLQTTNALSHDSRQLTRVLRFSEQPTVYELYKTALRIILTDTFFAQIKRCEGKMDEISEKMLATPEAEAQIPLRKDYEKWKDQRSLILKISAIAEHQIEIRALEALLQDSTTEKIVYLETRDAKQYLASVVDDYREIRDDFRRGRQPVIKEYLEKEQEGRSNINALESSIRRHSIIQFKTGELDEEVERKRVDDLINARIAEERTLLEKDLGVLLPELKKKPTTMRERKQAQRIPSSTSTSISALRSSLASAVSSSAVRSSSAPAASRPKGKDLKSLPVYQKEIENLKRKRNKLLGPVNGDAEKLDEAAKLKVEAVTHNLENVSQRILEIEQRAEAESSGNGPANTSVPKTSDSASKGESKEPKRETRRQRLTRHQPGLRIRKFLGESTLPKKGKTKAKGQLNLSPSKPMQAYHSTLSHHLGAATEGASRIDIEAPMSWMELSEEAKMRSLRGMAFAHAADNADCHMGSPSLHDLSDGSQSVYMASSSDNADDSPSQGTPPVEQEAFEATDSQSEAVAAEEELDMPLTYSIPTEAYRVAAMASSSSSGAYWSHKLYKGADNIAPKVLYCTSFDKAEERAQEFVGNPILGFDLEWEPKSSLANGNIKRNLSLIQIAAEDKIGLFQISLFKGDTAEDLMPPTLRRILESSDVIKTGVNVSGDMRRMKACLDVEMQGVIELSHLYRVVKFSAQEPHLVSFKLVSLSEQVQNVLLLPLRKDDVRMSSWSRTLNVEQTDYAATDAYAGFQLYHKLEKLRKKMSPTPPRPAFFETMQPIILGNGDVVERSAKKSAASKRPAAAVGAEEGEEDEVFFDAQEDLDTYELASSDPCASDSASGVPQPDDLAVASDEVAYPTLPQVPENAPSVPDEVVEQSNLDLPTTETTESKSTNRPSTEATTAADTWIATYLETHPQARPSSLRAYHLWHMQNLSLQNVAAAMREPPLALTTVASYVLEAVKVEGLEYDVERIRQPLEVLPRSVWGRYRGIVERVRKAERERGREL